MSIDVAIDDLPYEVFIGRGWEYDFVFDGEDLSNVSAATLGLSAISGVTASAFTYASAAGKLVFFYTPPDGVSEVGGEAPNTVGVRLLPADNAGWLAVTYAFQIGLTRPDGFVDTAIIGQINAETSL